MRKFRRRREDKNLNHNFSDIIIKNKIHLSILFLVLIFTVAIISSTCGLNVNVINNEKNQIFENVWKYSIDDGAFVDVVLPFSEGKQINSHITLKNRIPDKVIQGATILLRTSQQDVQVFVEDDHIYSSYEKNNNVHTSSSAYHFVRLPTDASGKQITVILSSPYEKFTGFMNQIYIGSKASNIFYLFKVNGVRFAIGFIVFSIGFFVMLIFLFAKKQENTVGIIYLGAFFVCAGFWVISESKLAQFLFPYPTALTNTSIFAMTLMPVFWGMYYYSTNIKHFRKFVKYLIVTMGLASFAMAVTSLYNAMMPLVILPYYLVLIGIYVIAVFIHIILANIRDGSLFSAPVCGLIAVGVCCLFELIFYLNNVREYNDSNFLTAGLILFCVMMSIDLAHNFAKSYQAAVNVKALTVLAYTDSLTGLRNRTAFLEQISDINMDDGFFITVAMFDINNLKIVNDTMGHLVGDAMIRHSVQALVNSVREKDELYRIGGDEFAAVIRHDKSLNQEILANRLVNILQKENLKSISYELSIAYGYAQFDREKDKDLLATLARADENMYACKRKQKHIE